MKKLNMIFATMIMFFNVSCGSDEQYEEIAGFFIGDPSASSSTITKDGMNAIDLGLGVLWADRNFEASEYYESGKFWKWGDFKNIIAQSGLDSGWHVPTYDDLSELLHNCTFTMVSRHDVEGVMVTSEKNGNTIFIPSAGYMYDKKKYNEGKIAAIWSSSSQFDSDDEFKAWSLVNYKSEKKIVIELNDPMFYLNLRLVYSPE